MIDPSVDQRVDAYRGNPQGLMDKFAQKHSLVDLLALQKLKDEKAAAIRETQLKMGQEGTPPTIADQREQQVLAMTREEVAKQQSDMLQQQQQGQLQKMQQTINQNMPQGVMPQGGLPSMPAPNVMPPQAMAAGGIVHFDKGGDKGLGRSMDAPPSTPSEGLLGGVLGRMQRGEPSENSLVALKRSIARKIVAGEPLTEQEQNIAARLNITAQDAAEPAGIPTVLPTKASDAGMTGMFPIRKDIGEASVIPPDAPDIVKGTPNIAPPRPAPTRQAAPAPAAPAPAAPAPAAPAETSFIPAEAKPLFDATQTQLRGELSRDAEAERARYTAEREAGIGAALKQAMAEKQARIDAIRAQDEAANRRDKDNALTEYLLGARGATVGETLRTAGLAGLNAERAASAAQRARAIEHDKMVSELTDVGLKEKLDTFTGGRGAAKETRDDVLAAAKESTSATNKLLDANIHRLDRDSQERVAAMNRASNERVAGMQVAVQRETNLISNQMRRDQYIETQRSRTLIYGLKPLRDQEAQFTSQTSMGVKLNPEQTKELKALRDLISLKEQEINTYYDDLAAKDYTGGKASGSAADKYPIKKITPPT